MEWLTWFGRWDERDRALARLKALKEAYGGHGERVIRLSARTDLARKSAGSTQRAFEFVERAFGSATQEYARIGELMDGLEQGLAKGRVGDFAAVDAALKGMGPKLDDLERHLTDWEAKWSQVPLAIDDAARSLAALRVQVEQAAAVVGAPLPLSDRVAAMEQHLERTRRVQADGNPVEAGHLVEDLRLAVEKVAGDVESYVSGAGAIAQAEQEIAAERQRLAASAGAEGAPPEATAALQAAEALLGGLRPSLAAGKLDHFQADLLALQQSLRTARTAISPSEKQGSSR